MRGEGGGGPRAADRAGGGDRPWRRGGRPGPDGRELEVVDVDDTLVAGDPLVTGVALGKSYARGAERVRALRSATFVLVPGELVVLVGPSGSGKSTLLGLLCGWELPDEGELAWAGWMGAVTSAALPWSTLAIIPQALGLIEDLSVAENVALPVRLGKAGAAGRPVHHPGTLTRAAGLLEAFGLQHLADRLPHECSLGERQRAAVARALVLEPDLILADEPTAHQDPAMARAVFGALRDAARQGAACLVATHNPEGPRYADRVLTLQDGELVEGAPSRRQA
jgi:ABC-type lipoprotein export system ATPase subunit